MGNSNSGFAGMSPEKRKLIAAKGGSAHHAKDRSFAKSRELAVRAGRLGGLVTQARKAEAKRLLLQGSR